MNKYEHNAGESLTGVWDGVFRQHTHGSVVFTATLIESGNQITGSTHERCTQFDCPRKTHLEIAMAVRSHSSKPMTRRDSDTTP